MAARRQASPEQVEGSLDPGMQRGVAVQRPDQKRSEDGLAKYLGDLRGWQVAADFATVLTKLDHLGVQSMNPPLQVHHGLTNWGRRKIGLKKGPNDGGIAGGLLSHADAEGAEELRHRFVGLARRLDGCFQFAELHLAGRGHACPSIRTRERSARPVSTCSCR